MLRPEPGNAATAARVEAMGLATIRLPLFRVVPRAWRVPAPARFDALLLTSANAVRHAGAGLARLAALPVCAVGAATADAARAAGLDVQITGTRGVAALLAEAAGAGVARVLHLAGEDWTSENGAAGAIVAARAIVYASEPAPVATVQIHALAGSVALLHSPRSAVRLAGLIDAAGVDRAGIRLAALSAAVLLAAGPRWERADVAAGPGDQELLEVARRLARGSLNG